MAQLIDCPDELLLQIASYLRPSDNKRLSVTAPRLRGPAQEVLHRNIKLAKSSNHLPAVLRTLAHRPDLMTKVRSIEIGEYMEHLLQLKDWEEVVEWTLPISELWGSRYKQQWIYQVGMKHRRACMALLLFLAPELQYLSIVHDSERWPCASINFSNMFLPVGNLPTEPDLMLLPELTTLSIPMIHLNKSWFSLPPLRHLDIDCTRDIRQLAPDTPTQNIHSLMIRCTENLTNGLSYLDPLSSLLGQFPNVNSLVIKYTGWGEEAVWVEQDYDFNQYSGFFKLKKKRIIGGPGETFSHFTDELITIASQLEYLELVCPDTGDFRDFNYCFPLWTLQQFTQLKRLCIPQGAFIYTTGIRPRILAGSVSPSPLRVLPPTLEYLCVSYPTPAIIEWLGGILEDRDQLPNLALVDLDFGDGPPDVLSDYTDYICRIGTALFNSGVVLRVKK
ncbi:hypothetical protein CFE70_000467 [Pyrenophora teres f. teres 0-1]|uniref:F-box domain-containing protein n=2 Tax=Pyrenophora teres f. teres TaxID=97479 RepID=E3RX84_PYRTT|nr:hypothetical protein PTT_13988 [Pyrenophora teres f. teres 0-1]